MNCLTMNLLIGCVLFLRSQFTVTHGFSISRINVLSSLSKIAPQHDHRDVPIMRSSSLQASPKFTMPSQEECVQLGIREWPQQTKSSLSWREEIKQGQTLVRYILQGSGTVSVVDGNFSRKFYAGTLLEVEGPETLMWERNEGEDVIVLTPGFENGALFAGAIVGFVTMVFALLALS